MPQENEAPESKLDGLLKEWDEKKVDPNMGEVLTRLGKLEEENKDLREKADATEKATKESDEAASYKADIAPVIKTLKGKGEDEVNASDEYIEEWINTEGRTNKKLANAWDNRAKEPEALDKIVEELIPKFKESAEKEAMSILNVKPEEIVTDDNANNADRQASRASRIARNANNGAGGDDYDDVNWAGLTGHEFAEKSQKVFADMRSGKLKPE